MAANTIGVHQCAASKTLPEVCKAINEVAGTKYLYLPRNTEEMREIVSKFEVKFGLLQAFGCNDETHVPLKRPLINSQDSYNYKQFFSLNVQVVCDSQGRFIDVECKWPGLVHGAKSLHKFHSVENKQVVFNRLLRSVRN